METTEKNMLLMQLKEEQLRLASVMSESDAHACKCIKMGIKFSEEYPEEYNAYIEARGWYNDNEKKISLIESELAKIVEPENIVQS